jgi:hypothetical protein
MARIKERKGKIKLGRLKLGCFGAKRRSCFLCVLCAFAVK